MHGSEPLAALGSRLARSSGSAHAFLPTTPGFRGLIDRFLSDRERLLAEPAMDQQLD
jgi:hypothetical protein